MSMWCWIYLGFNPWVLLMEVAGFSCFFVGFALWLVFFLVHGLHVWFEHESMLACAFRSGFEWNMWICLGLFNSEIFWDSYGEIDCWRLIYYMSSISVYNLTWKYGYLNTFWEFIRKSYKSVKWIVSVFVVIKYS